MARTDQSCPFCGTKMHSTPRGEVVICPKDGHEEPVRVEAPVEETPTETTTKKTGKKKKTA